MFQLICIVYVLFYISLKFGFAAGLAAFGVLNLVMPYPVQAIQGVVRVVNK